MSDVDGLRVAAFVGLVVLVWELAGRLKLAGFIRGGDARKMNHVAALVGGALIFGWAPEPIARASCYVGMAVGFTLLVLVCHFRDHPLFRRMFHGYARESDAPHEGFHVWFSWLVSMVGLLALDSLFWDMSITRTAALVLGIGDGLAEPVGVRWGQTRYRVPTLVGRPAVRSLEGSAAVFTGTLLVILACTGPEAVAVALLVAGAVTLAEAASPHGLDNLTIPLTAGTLLLLSGGELAW